MSSKFQYDKKQLPQVIVMGVLSLGLFGFFGWRMAYVPPTQAAVAAPKPADDRQAAATDPAAPGPVAPGAAPASAVATATPAEADGAPDAPAAPTSGMRDPFAVPDNAAPKTVALSAPPPPLPVPAMKQFQSAPMPALPSVQPLTFGAPPTQAAARAAPTAPAAPAAPTWQVTGVIVGDSDAANHVAILRDGDQRRYVKPGDTVDGEYRVETVDQDGVTLTRGTDRFRLTLGGNPAAPKHVPVPNGASTTGIGTNLDNQKTESTGKRHMLSAGLPSITE